MSQQFEERTRYKVIRMLVKTNFLRTNESYYRRGLGVVFKVLSLVFIKE